MLLGSGVGGAGCYDLLIVCLVLANDANTQCYISSPFLRKPECFSRERHQVVYAPTCFEDFWTTARIDKGAFRMIMGWGLNEMVLETCQMWTLGYCRTPLQRAKGNLRKVPQTDALRRSCVNSAQNCVSLLFTHFCCFPFLYLRRFSYHSTTFQRTK